MDQNELVRKIYSENIDEIEKRIGKSKMPISFQVLKSFSLKMDDLLKSVSAIADVESFYSSQALIRVVYEHFLVAYYIWTKSRISQNDECAIDYLQYYPMAEMMKQENYNSKLDKSYDPTKTPLQNFLLKAPEFNTDDPLDQDNFQDINTRANQFDIRKILKYMQDELDPNDAFKSLHVLVIDVCRKYNKTSSYIHGGRMAELEAYENRPKVDKAKVLQDNVAFAKIFSREVLSFTMLLLLSEDSTFIKIYQPVFDYIKESTKNVRDSMSNL